MHGSKSLILKTRIVLAHNQLKDILFLKIKANMKYAAAAAKSLQSCPTLCDPTDGSPPGSPIPGILQARTLEWVAISFSNGWKWKVKVKPLSHVRLVETPWTAAHQAPPSMGFSRQEHWSGVRQLYEEGILFPISYPRYWKPGCRRSQSRWFQIFRSPPTRPPGVKGRRLWWWWLIIVLFARLFSCRSLLL